MYDERDILLLLFICSGEIMLNIYAKKRESSSKLFLIRVLQGMLIGLGAVLPGVSGGVLCVVFGIYRPVMEVLANPVHGLKKHLNLLIPVILGGLIGFLGVSNILSFFLNRYPDVSVCLFAGLIIGMLPGMFRQANEKGKYKGDWGCLVSGFVILLAILLGFRLFSIEAVQNVFSWLFCGFCAALSLIVPGMSFSTFLMPLNLYTPFVDAIGHLNLPVLIPAGIGALVTLALLSRGVNRLFERHYSKAFYTIIGITAAATLMIIPYSAFVSSVNSAALCGGILVLGMAGGYLLDQYNAQYEDETD